MPKKRSKSVGPPRKIVFVLLTLLFFFAFPEKSIAAITGKIAGTVTEAETGEPLPLANCIIEGTEMGAACDTEGDYYIINVPPGTYSVTVRMMGYEAVTKTDIKVTVDHTTHVDFELRSVAVEVPGITVSAKREIIKMDLSSSEIIADVDDINEIPLVTNVEDFIMLSAGVQQDWVIRGGGADQTKFMVDGLTIVDNRTNIPLFTPNLSTIKEVVTLKGGFNAEYGNVRSGVVNIITQEGSPDKYHGSADFRWAPPQMKHGGPDFLSSEVYYLRPFVDTTDQVCWIGTDSAWSEEMQDQYPEFAGWNNISADPEAARNAFIWSHAMKGSGEFGQIEQNYHDRPDWSVDAGFGGPIPGINNLTFFTSYRRNREMFALPTIRDYYEEDNVQLKLSYHITQNIKFGVIGMYGKINSVAATQGQPDNDHYLKGGEAMLYANYGSSNYFPEALSPFEVNMNVLGISFDHALSTNTFYNLRLTRTYRENSCEGPTKVRDTTTVKKFGDIKVDEIPYGVIAGYSIQTINGDRFGQDAFCAVRDRSYSTSITFEGDLTSQINKYNQIKVGFTAVYDDLHTLYAHMKQSKPGTYYEWWTLDDPWEEVLAGNPDNWKIEWDHQPYRAGTYIQDKIEIAGIIANIGARLDYNNPNCEWYTIDRYSMYLSKPYKLVFTEVAPTEPAESHLKFSPRFGISHPIGITTKLFFNYGWFYSMGRSPNLYTIDYGRTAEGIVFLGNPSADLPRTVAYELGFEREMLGQFLLRISGYYKDVENQTGTVQYTDFYGLVDYSTIENNNYADIRGFEITLEKRFGRWLTGWFNYDYMVQTSGYSGRAHYFQDPREQRIYGLQNPYQEKALPRPRLNAYVTLMTPQDWGELFGDIHLSIKYSRTAGQYFTWDPLDTDTLVNNLQWPDIADFDLRLSKGFTFAGTDIALFIDVNNPFNTKTFGLIYEAFYDDIDQMHYLESLHLPMYNKEEYPYEGGNDKVGEYKSDAKPYINDPNLTHRYNLNPRRISFGLRVSF